MLLYYFQFDLSVLLLASIHVTKPRIISARLFDVNLLFVILTIVILFAIVFVIVIHSNVWKY